MKAEYGKDILRSIKKGGKRFLSLVAITTLGVTMMTCIYAACKDVYYSADRFYDAQNLFDIRILSTLGLTDEDVAALEKVNGVEAAEGSYSESVYTLVDGMRKTAEMTVLSQKGLNMPYVVEGRLPDKPGEIAVTQNYLSASGKTLGETLTIEEDLEKDGAADNSGTSGEDDDTEISLDEAESPNFLNTTYTITGTVIDPKNINSTEDGKTFRSSAADDYNFYLMAEDVDTKVYTSVYLTLAGAAGFESYSEEYDSAVGAVVSSIETVIMKQREKARYDAVLSEAKDKIDDARSEMEEKFAEADEELQDAQTELEDGRRKILDGEEELTEKEKDAKQKFASARDELESGKAQLKSAREELTSKETELEAGWKALQDGERQLSQGRQKAEGEFAQADRQFREKREQLDASTGTLSAQVEQLKGVFGGNWPQTQFDALAEAASVRMYELILADPSTEPDPAAVGLATVEEQNKLAAAILASQSPGAAMTQECIQAALGLGMLNGSRQALDVNETAYKAQKDAALKELSENEAELAENRLLLENARKQLAEGKAELERRTAQLAEGEKELVLNEKDAGLQFSDARQEIEENRTKLDEGEETLTENLKDYREKRADAEQKLDEAYAKLDDIDAAQWYVQDRSSLESYSGMKNDMSSIETIGKVFPFIFLIVAILISLTTMTRMVEEERGLIGTYKALGLSDWSITMKYLVFALLACLTGGILGNVLGFAILPGYLLDILKALYTLPYFVLRFDALYGLGGVLLFVAAIAGATVHACRSELRHMPASLMRPKAPRAGSRIFLERIPLIWNNLKFLNKVTARNLFRYKKRLFMTIIGIMGCTTLVFVGFAIRDSVRDLLPKQYEGIYKYDLMLVAMPDDNDKLTELMDNEENVTDYLNVQIENVDVINAGGESSGVQLMVIPDGHSLEDYIQLPDRNGVPLSLGEDGILITQNAAELLGLNPGDSVTLQNLKLERRETAVTDIVRNYLGNCVYMTEAQYEALFGGYSPNGALARLSDTLTDHGAYAQDLLDHDFLVTSLSIQTQKVDFAKNFTILNAVIYLLIVLAAGLAFVVLFTLSNTNISERVRELATIKVLGFYDREVYTYVNKEMLIFTAMGVLAGLPAGRAVSELLTTVLKMPSIYFAVYIHPLSYLISGLISFGFALIVSFMTKRTLDRINMVEALKSVE